jgi:hypothetical protein
MKGRVGFVRPTTGDETPVPIGWVLFARHTRDGAPRLQPVQPGQAAFTLLAHALNREHVPNAVSVATAITSAADCYRLDAGDIDETCALVDRMAA